MTLRDATGKKIGQIEDKGDKLVAYDASGRKVGHWDKKSDVTHDASGRRVGTGNLLATLL